VTALTDEVKGATVVVVASLAGATALVGGGLVTTGDDGTGRVNMGALIGCVDLVQPETPPAIAVTATAAATANR
jgi:hypothetical protein